MDNSLALRFLAFFALSATNFCLDADEIEFKRKGSQVSDVVYQQIDLHLAAKRQIRQQNQLVDSSAQALDRQQDRTLTILALQDGAPSRAKLAYKKAMSSIRVDNKPAVKSQAPVAGHAYFVVRENGKLTFARIDGEPVSAEEAEILQRHLQTFGKPNPLATFLDGKRIQIGETLDVPDRVAQELLGITGNSAKTGKMQLRLTRTEHHDAEVCAVFETLLRTSGRETSMSLIMKGQLVVEINSCRTRLIRLEGPVAISETRGPTIGQFVVSTNGTLKVESRNRFGGIGRLARKTNNSTATN